MGSFSTRKIDKKDSPLLLSAQDCQVLCCHYCGLASRKKNITGHQKCPRCGGTLHFRIPNSLSKSWALLISAYILFIPANTLPIMETGSLFGSQADTIMSGVVYLWSTGSWPLAALVFFASIVVPISKLIALSFLLYSVKLNSQKHRKERTQIYRILEFVGRWSMLDIYVVTLLSALVQLNTLATITPGPGAIAFGCVVVLTMLAAMSFDPRLIWDQNKIVSQDEISSSARTEKTI